MSGGNSSGGTTGGIGSVAQPLIGSAFNPTQTAPNHWSVGIGQQQPQPQVSSNSPMTPQPAAQSPVQSGYAAWDPTMHYGQAGQMVSYNGQNYRSLGDMPNGQTGYGGGTWNENSRPDWTPQLWEQVPQQAAPPVAAPAAPSVASPVMAGATFTGARPEAWQLTGLKKGGLASLVKGKIK